MTASVASSDAPPEHSRRLRAQPFGLAIAVAANAVLPIGVVSALGPVLAVTAGIDARLIGLAVATFFLAGGVASVLAGRLVDRYGWRAGVVASSAACVLCLLGLAVSPASPPAMLAWLVVGGLGGALAMPASNVILAGEAPDHRLGLALGVKQAAIPAVIFLAGVAIPAIALTLGWRALVALAAIVPLGTAAVARRHRGGRPIVRTHGAEDRVVDIWPVAVAGACASGVAGILLGYWAPAAMRTGLSVTAAASLLALANLVGLGVRVSGGWFADRRGSDGLLPAALLLALGAVGLGLVATQQRALVVPGALLAFGGAWGWPGLFFLAALRRYPGAPGAASGLLEAASSVGIVVAPLVFGVLSPAGWPSAWLLAVGLSLAAAAFLALAARRPPRPALLPG